MDDSPAFVDEEDVVSDANTIDFKLIRESINREDLLLHVQIVSFAIDVEVKATWFLNVTRRLTFNDLNLHALLNLHKNIVILNGT